MYDLGNRDGFGMMWVEDGRVKTEKSMQSWQGIMDLYKTKMDNDIAVHVRNATFGEKNIPNCHPYEVLSIDLGDKIDLWMMHNGTIRDVQVDKTMSDSWNFATKFLRGLLRKRPGLLQEKEFQTFLSAIIGANKLVFLDSKNRFTIVNEDLGAYHPTGVWLSTKNEVKVQTYIPPVTVVKDDQWKHSATPKIGDWRYKIGGWDHDSDGRIHYNPDLTKADASKEEKEKADGNTDAVLEGEVVGISNGTHEIDQEGVMAAFLSIPTKKRGDTYNFVLEYPNEAIFLLTEYGGKKQEDAKTLVYQQSWETVDILSKIAANYIGQANGISDSSN